MKNSGAAPVLFGACLASTAIHQCSCFTASPRVSVVSSRRPSGSPSHTFLRRSNSARLLSKRPSSATSSPTAAAASGAAAAAGGGDGDGGHSRSGRGKSTFDPSASTEGTRRRHQKARRRTLLSGSAGDSSSSSSSSTVREPAAAADQQQQQPLTTSQQLRAEVAARRSRAWGLVGFPPPPAGGFDGQGLGLPAPWGDDESRRGAGLVTAKPAAFLGEDAADDAADGGRHQDGHDDDERQRLLDMTQPPPELLTAAETRLIDDRTAAAPTAAASSRVSSQQEKQPQENARLLQGAGEEEGVSLWASRGMLAGAAMLYGTNFGCVKLLEESVPMSLAAALRFSVALVPFVPFLRKVNPGVFRAGAEFQPERASVYCHSRTKGHDGINTAADYRNPTRTHHHRLHHRTTIMSDAADDGQAAGGGSGSGRSSTASTRQTTLPIVVGPVDRGGSPPPPRSKNPKAAKLRFPADVPADVKDAILNFDPPAGLLIADIPNDTTTPSVTAFYGVRLDVKPAEGKTLEASRKQKYMCLANQECRTARKLVSVSTSSTTGATNHLKNQHSIQSAASLAQQQSKEAANDSVESVKQSKIFTSDPKRWNALSIVKSFVIQHAIPFSMFEDPRVRHTLSVLVPDDKIDVEALHNKAVKKHVVELYHATIRAVTADLQKEIRAALLPIVYINTDLWTSKVSGDKYIGVRIFFIDSQGILQTMLLAVKLFRPDPSLGKVTGRVVLLWLIQVLAQNGLRKSNIAGAVTDAGADVRTGVGDAFDREWCGPHMANRATIDGTGMSPTKAASKNPRCRELLELCKKVVEFVNRSSSFKIQLEDVIEEATDGKGSKAKLTQAVVQRWISICLMLLRLLQRWDALRTVYLNRNLPFPLAGKKNEMEEVYSIVKVVSDDILYCQRTSEPTAEWALENLVVLLTETLEPEHPLEVLHVAPIGGDGSGPSSTLRSHEDLTEIGRQTRDSFRIAFAKRFLPRYGAGLAGRSHLFDRTMLLSPSARQMKYIDRLLASTAAVGMALVPAAQIKAKIKAEVVSLLVKAIIEKRTRDKKTKNTVDVVDTPVAKRPRSSGRGGAVRAAPTVTGRRRRTAGLRDDSDDEVNNDSQVERDAHEEADAILQTWLTLQIPSEHKEEDGAEYWRVYGKEQPEVLRAVAQNVFGVPASAGVMERDFCIADYFLPRKRGSLDPGNLEMCLYLRAQFDRIPPDIPKLSDVASQAAIPERFKDPALLQQVEVLDYVVDDQPAEDVDPEGPEWVIRDRHDLAEDQDEGEEKADATNVSDTAPGVQYELPS